MNVVIFGLAIVVYILICYWGVRIYFSSVAKAHKGIDSPITRNLVIYALFFAFIAIELPVAIFFPAWLSEKLMVFKRTSEITAILLAFGSCVLIGAVWKGWRSDDGRMFAKAMSQR